MVKTIKKKGIKRIEWISRKNPEDKRIVAEIDSSKKHIDYFVHYEAPQYKWIRKIVIHGFDKIPPGFAKDGSGFVKGAAYLILKTIYDQLGDFDLLVSLRAKNSIKKSGGKYKVVLNYLDLRQAIETLQEIKKENYQTLKISTKSYLNKIFPRIFKVEDSIIDKFVYQKNQLAELLKRKGIFENLSNKDIEAIIEFFPLFLKHYKDRLKGEKKLVGILNSKQATEFFYLDKIIKEFDKKIKAKVQNENSWQKFFRAYIQIFNPTYATVFEKKNISLAGDFPDFLPIDIYGYLDIYEIKKPNTKLLSLDGSRKNYYWSSEMAKAISQVENYIDKVTRFAPEIRDHIRKYEGIDIKIVKPRGIIIAGKRDQLKGEKMEDDFKILSNSMKNIEIVLFDDILNNLRSFIDRMQYKQKRKE